MSKFFKFWWKFIYIKFEKKINKNAHFLKTNSKKIKTNAFNIRVAHLWFANIDIQFILDPYAVTTYCTSYMTKIFKSITSKLHFIIKKCITNNIDANTIIQKLGNVFLDAQQWLFNLLLISCFLYHYIVHFKHFNS
jgi:hypothetical protein